MKIVNPSATIIEKELAGLSVCQRIDRCASVCYQRPPKPTEEEAQAFCRKLIERGHLPALEFATIHLAMPFWDSLDYREEKYLHVSTAPSNPAGIVSGSIRAFMESDYGSNMWNFLASELPLFFTESDRQRGDISFARPEEIPWQHRHVAVRVICSRATSHQLVRHRPCSFLQESQRYCKYGDGIEVIAPQWFGGDRAIDAKWTNHMRYCSSEYKTLCAWGLSPQEARGVLPNDTKTELIMYASLPEWLHIFKMRCAKAADPEMRRIMVPLREQFKTEYPEMWEEA